jgi:hypothetical protein
MDAVQPTIPDELVLAFIDRTSRAPYPFDGELPDYETRWVDMYDFEISAQWTGVPVADIKAKLTDMLDRDLITGCDCGCRGDFEITENGKRLLQHTFENR